MRHADHDVGDALSGRALDRAIEQRDQALRALEREALRAEELLLDELLEERRLGQLRQDAQLFLARHLEAVLRPLQALAQPVRAHHVVDVHVLHADRTAIRRAQLLQDLAQRHRRRTEELAGREAAVEVSVAEAVRLGVELGQLRSRSFERIDLRDEVTARAERADELIDLVLLCRDLARREHRVRLPVPVRARALDLGRVEDRRRAEARSLARRVLAGAGQALEIGSPIGRDRGGVLLPGHEKVLGEGQAGGVRGRFRVAHGGRRNVAWKRWGARPGLLGGGG